LGGLWALEWVWHIAETNLRCAEISGIYMPNPSIVAPIAFASKKVIVVLFISSTFKLSDQASKSSTYRSERIASALIGIGLQLDREYNVGCE